ncbi:hypothetical protein OKW33_005071 [Paraburkholderia atlantica]
MMLILEFGKAALLTVPATTLVECRRRRGDPACVALYSTSNSNFTPSLTLLRFISRHLLQFGCLIGHAPVVKFCIESTEVIRQVSTVVTWARMCVCVGLKGIAHIVYRNLASRANAMIDGQVSATAAQIHSLQRYFPFYLSQLLAFLLGKTGECHDRQQRKGPDDEKSHREVIDYQMICAVPMNLRCDRQA